MEKVKTQLDEALDLVLKLPLKERLQLIEQAVSSVGHDIESKPAETEAPVTEHWGKSLNALLDSLDMSDWQALEIDDPVKWVEKQRADELKQRLGDWGDTP